MSQSLKGKLIVVAVVLASLVATLALAQAPAKAPTKATPAAGTTIVLVHGAFADGSSWAKVIPLLQAKGYRVVAVHDPLSSLADDVATTKRAIDAAPGDVILVGHSYGGAVITEAGNNPKVTKLVYVAAFAPDANESINDLGKGQPAPAWLAALEIDEGGFASLPDQVVMRDFAQDLPAGQTRVLAAVQAPIATKAFDDKVKTAAWKTKPSWYVRTEQDHMIDPAAQAQMAKRMKATTTSVKASHVVMLSRPNDVAAVILAAAAAPAQAVSTK